MVEFVNLIEDVLLQILSFLDPIDLFAIQCLQIERLNHLVGLRLKRCSGAMLMSGTKCFKDRRSNLVTLDDRLRVHSNWLNGQFQSRSFFEKDHHFKHIGRFRMDNDNFYVSNKGEIRKYERSGDGYTCGTMTSYGDTEDPIISTMVLEGPHLFVGTYYGTCSYIRDGMRVIDNQKIHDSFKDILAMDFDSGKRILATSNFREIKLFRVNDPAIDMVAEADWRARCLTMDPHSDRLLVGNICTDFHGADGFIITLNPLSVYDINTMAKRDLHSSTSGVVDIVWYSPSAILTGHWSGDLRIFDLRSESDQLSIKKAGKEDVNVSLQFDGHHGVVCGFRNSNEVCLYDLRNSKDHVKTFGKFKSAEMTAYLVEVIADPSHLFVVNFDDVQMCEFE